MKVELMYVPGCGSFQRALTILQAAIAEERLPIAVELIETNASGTKHIPILRIDGQEMVEHELSVFPCLDQLSAILRQRWKELTAI